MVEKLMTYSKTCNLISKSKFLSKILGLCPRHGLFLYPKRFRMNSAYVDEEANYMVGCKYCKEEAYEYYQELWDNFYSGCL